MKGEGKASRGRNVLPTLPAIASRILEIVLDENYDPAELADAIQADPSMTVRLLEIVNSAVMGLRYPVKGVQHAITVLGDKNVRMIVFGVTVRQALDCDPQHSHVDRHLFWKHATATAAAARALANMTGIANPEEAYLCGLLHDLGRLALAIAEPEPFRRFLEEMRVRDHDDAGSVERRIFGVGHDEAGAELAREWQLPEAFRDALGAHHSPETLYERPEVLANLLRVLAAADYLSSVSGYPAYESRRPPRREAWFQEVLDQVELDYVIAAIQEELARMEPLFEYGPEDDQRWRALFLRTNAELSRVVMELEERHRVQRALNTTLVRSRSVPGRKGPVDRLLQECVANFGFDRAWILRIPPEQRHVETYAIASESQAAQDEFGLEDFAIHETDDLSCSSGFRVDDPRGDEFQARLLRELGATSGIVVPIRQDLRIAYLIGVDRIDGQELPAVDPSIIQVLAEEAGLMIQNEELYRKISDLAVTDPLTRVSNRRNVMDTLQREVQLSQRTGSPMAVAMFDLDHFKAINDTFGHQTGDEVLEQMAEILRTNVRRGDVVGRYGGEEFLVVLPGADLRQAREIAERIRVAVRAYGREHGERFRGRTISTSGGVAQLETEDQTFDRLIARCDEALYDAKARGRDRVVSAGAGVGA